jgi:hypothetical protein
MFAVETMNQKAKVLRQRWKGIDPVQRLTNCKRKYASLFIAFVLTSLALVLLTMSASAQEVKTDNQQQPAATTTQDATPDQQGLVSTTPEPEKAPKAPYFGPAKLDWTTTAKYSSMFRLLPKSTPISSTVANPNNYNQDDGDNNFHGGLVSDRTDFLTEMDISFGKNFGFRASAAAWWDPIYNQRTANRNSVSYNENFSAGFPTAWLASPDSAHFGSATKDLEFLQAELLDAFVHVRIPMGQSTMTIRGGQFAQQWGQTLFFGGNGIAGTMAPIDLIKLLSVPNAEFKEIIRPVPQVSMNLQITPKVSIGGYYQLRFVETRFPSVGSYFSNGDVLGQGATRWFVPSAPTPGSGMQPWLLREHDITAKNSGQFGVQLSVRAPHGWDLGFYGVQFHDTAPQLYITPGAGPDVGVLSPMEIGEYNEAYAENIKAFGMSASKTTGIINWAAEVSGRLNQDLAVAVSIPTAPVTVPGVGIVAYAPAYNVAGNNKNPAYPTGDTLHANFSTLIQLHPNAIAKDSALVAEVAWNELVSVTRAGVTPGPVGSPNWWTSESNATKHAVAFMAVYTPTYHQVRPGLDLSVPIGINFSPYGRSVLGPAFGVEHGGFFNAGLSLAYHDANRFTVTYQNFIGAQDGGVNAAGKFSYKQNYGDRDYLVFSIYRTFGLRASQKAH